MRVTLVALLVGLASGLLALAVSRHLREIPLSPVRWPALLVVAVLTYRLPAWLDTSGALGPGLALAAYAGLVVFCAANVRLRGMVVVLVGLVCNAAVLVVNRAMPVDEEAVVAAGVARTEDIARIDLDAPREWRTSEHRLVLLTDIIPVAALREVVSFGDLILAAGLANVVFRMLPPLVGPKPPAGTRRARRRRRRPPRPAVPEAREPNGDAGWDIWEADGRDDPDAAEQDAGDRKGEDAGERPATRTERGEERPPDDGEPERADADEPAG